MNRFELWLLNKLVQKILYYRCSQHLFDIIWKHGRTLYYEDNPYTRYGLFHEKLRVSYKTEVHQLRKGQH